MKAVLLCIPWLLVSVIGTYRYKTKKYSPVAAVAPQPKHYYSGARTKRDGFLPAAPWQRPACASPTDTYCTTIDTYPTARIEYLVKQSKFDLESLFVSESLEVSPFPISIPLKTSGSSNVKVYSRPSRRYTAPINITAIANNMYSSLYSAPRQRRQFRAYRRGMRYKRQVRSPDQLCPSRTQYISPKAALSNKGDWKYVVHLPKVSPKIQQFVQTEKCVGSVCRGLCEIPDGFTSKCTQKFVQKKMVALQGGGKKLYTDLFCFPHCCVCEVTLA